MRSRRDESGPLPEHSYRTPLFSVSAVWVQCFPEQYHINITHFATTERGVLSTAKNISPQMNYLFNCYHMEWHLQKIKSS